MDFEKEFTEKLNKIINDAIQWGQYNSLYHVHPDYLKLLDEQRSELIAMFRNKEHLNIMMVDSGSQDWVKKNVESGLMTKAEVMTKFLDIGDKECE